MEKKDKAFDIYEVTFSNPNIKTVRDYINYASSPIYCKDYIDNPDLFLQVVDLDNKTNRKRIEDQYTTHEERDLIGKGANELIIKVGTKLVIPAEKVRKEALLTEGIEVKPMNEPLFKATQLATLEMDQKYVPVISEDRISGDVRDVYPDYTVWIWCKGLGSKGEDVGESELSSGDGGLVDITRFVEAISTNVGYNGGNFSIKLPPLSIVRTEETEEWEVVSAIDKLSIVEEYNKNCYVGDYVTRDGGEGYSPVFFHHVISQNDVVFIRFETLEKEIEDSNIESFISDVNSDNLPGRIYDMIGLVDNNVLDVSPNDVSVTILGRDLSKLFIDDGCYFYPLELAQGALTFAGGATEKNVLMRRVAGSGVLQFIGLYYNRSILDIIRFVIAQLCNIKVAPNKLFESWGERRNMRFKKETLDSQEDSSTSSLKTLNQREEDKKQNALDEMNASKGVNNQTISVEQQRQQQKSFEEYKAFIQAVEEQGYDSKKLSWKEFTFTNSRGIKEEISANGYPQSVSSDISNIQENELRSINKNLSDSSSINKSKPVYQGQSNKEPMPGIWAIVKIALDSQISRRLVVDSSFSSANGSILNFLRKACQEPFVELLMDTYGDEYVLTVRKPPTDKVSYEKLLKDAICNTENGLSYNLIIDVEESVVEQENLQFETEIYSWYHFTPQNSFIGSAGQFTLHYLPAVFLPEYAEVWGSRPYDVYHNYVVDIADRPAKEDELSENEKQAFMDYAFLIESTSYLPFTRKGTITLALGDRRLKVGNFIRYKRTGEIFKIDSVSQSGTITGNSIDRRTTLQVSRGMVEEFILNESNSYFDIVNVTLNLDAKTQQEQFKTVYKEVKKEIDMTPEEKKQIKDNNSNSSNQGLESPLPGFNEYLQHQQGSTGAQRLWDKAIYDKGRGISPSTMKVNTRRNAKGVYIPQGDYDTSQKSAREFLKHMISYYNNDYKTAQATPSAYDKTIREVSSLVGVGYDVLKAFAQVESAQGKITKSSHGYRGIMQIGSTFAKQYGYSFDEMYDARKNITCAAKGIRANSLKRVVNEVELQKIDSTNNASKIDSTEQKQAATRGKKIIITKEATQEKDGYKTVPDRANILNVYVQSGTFAFFIKNLQFLGYKPEGRSTKITISDI